MFFEAVQRPIAPTLTLSPCPDPDAGSPRPATHQLQVLLRVGGQHLLQAVQRPLLGQGAKVLGQGDGVDGVRVDDAALDVADVAALEGGGGVGLGLGLGLE